LLPFLLLAVLAEPGCRSDSERREVEVEVQQVGIDPTSHSPVVILREKEGGAQLPIWIGPSEAGAIAMHMEGVESPRPLTHDLTKSMLESTGIRVERVLIHKLVHGTYYARIYLMARGKAVEVDSRPSDAIALALRFESPIFVATRLLSDLGVSATRWGDATTLTVQGVTVQALSDEMAEHFGLTAGRGVLVSGVAPDAGSKLLPGDVILEVDGEEVGGMAEFARMIRDAERKPDLAVKRGGRRVHILLEPLRR
jgi:bifunctional DNase/RNase